MAIFSLCTSFDKLCIAVSQASKTPSRSNHSNITSAVSDLANQMGLMSLSSNPLCDAIKPSAEQSELDYLDLAAHVSKIQKIYFKFLVSNSEKTVSSSLERALSFITSPFSIAKKLYDPKKDALDHLPSKTTTFFLHHAIGKTPRNEAPIGKGSYGEVWRVSLDGKPFACKKMNLQHLQASQYLNQEASLEETPKDIQLKRECVESFEKEVSSLLKLTHPNIISLLAVAREEEMPVLYLELAHQSLSQFLEENNELPFRQQCKMFAQVASALDHIHSKGILYRDLSLDNILLSAEGDIKVCDFGLASLYNKEKNIAMWTPLYAAPESIRQEYISSKCDVWAFGVILYYVIVKEFPYPAKQIQDVSDEGSEISRLENPVEYRTRLYKALLLNKCDINPLFTEKEWETYPHSEAWKDLIKRCLEPSPKDRPTMKEIYNDLAPGANLPCMI